jgi:hypothetical protein
MSSVAAKPLTAPPPTPQPAFLGQRLACPKRGRGVLTFEEIGRGRAHRMLRAIFEDGSVLEGIEMVIKAHGVVFLPSWVAGEVEHAALLGHHAAQGMGLVERAVRAVEFDGRKAWAA